MNMTQALVILWLYLALGRLSEMLRLFSVRGKHWLYYASVMSNFFLWPIDLLLFLLNRGIGTRALEIAIDSSEYGWRTAGKELDMETAKTRIAELELELSICQEQLSKEWACSEN